MSKKELTPEELKNIDGGSLTSGNDFTHLKANTGLSASASQQDEDGNSSEFGAGYGNGVDYTTED